MEKQKSGHYTIGIMDPEEVDLAVEWAAREGWNPGLYDAQCFRSVDPEGFLAGRLDGKMVASISAVRWNGNFGFVGFYIVEPEYRGKGYGLSLWNEALARLRTRCAVIGLDGVLERRSDYRKSGFADACGNIRYRGSFAVLQDDLKGALSQSEGHSSTSHVSTKNPEPWLPGAGAANSGTAKDAGFKARMAGLAEFSSIYKYDRGCFPADRSGFLELWLTRPGTLVSVLDREDSPGGKTLGGYGVLRPCREGWKVGPLFADDEEAALDLLGSLLAGVPRPLQGSWYLDVPGTNKAARTLADGLGMEAVFETARMYSGPAPRIEEGRVFGITSFELG